ncbi:MAG: hypothetical protein MRQ13_04980 [Candidatus Midichloria sp.]|nr:hypothetical protein [Candidatus Midichloria sp.]
MVTLSAENFANSISSIQQVAAIASKVLEYPEVYCPKINLYTLSQR